MSASPRMVSSAAMRSYGGGLERGAASLARSSRLQAITDVVGAEAAAKLVSDFGGRRIYVPQVPARGDLLARSIGLAAETRLSRVYAGDRLDIPARPEPASRRARIFVLRRGGDSISTIARRLRCTERYVYKVLASLRRR
jgi:Mor family transcriptional regulator